MASEHNRLGRPEPIVITGIGLIASLGDDRETVWQRVRDGRSGIRSLRGITDVPESISIGAPVTIERDFPGQLKAVRLNLHAAEEALADADVDFRQVDLDRFGCAISAHMGDAGWLYEQCGRWDIAAARAIPWWRQWFPNTACATVAARYGLRGPRLCHSAACASGLIEVLSATRSIQDGQCDIALAGSAEAFDPLFAAGFQAMRVLAHHDDPAQASRPFDSRRSGFVMGEGAAIFVIERLSHALRRGARIYAEIAGGNMHTDAHHITGMDSDSETLAHLIAATLRRSQIGPPDVGYINAHGTGTQQNDVV